MARYLKDVATGLSRTEAKSVISGYLTGQGFTCGPEGGEMVWRKGAGTLIAPQFVKAEPQDDRVHIEAWIPQVVLLPGVYAGEQSLDGLYGWAAKATLRARVSELEARLSYGRAGATSPTGAIVPLGAPKKPEGWYPDPIGKHASRYWDGSMWTTKVAD